MAQCPVLLCTTVRCSRTFKSRCNPGLRNTRRKNASRGVLRSPGGYMRSLSTRVDIRLMFTQNSFKCWVIINIISARVYIWLTIIQNVHIIRMYEYGVYHILWDLYIEPLLLVKQLFLDGLLWNELPILLVGNVREQFVLPQFDCLIYCIAVSAPVIYIHILLWLWSLCKIGRSENFRTTGDIRFCGSKVNQKVHNFFVMFRKTKLQIMDLSLQCCQNFLKNFFELVVEIRWR